MTSSKTTPKVAQEVAYLGTITLGSHFFEVTQFTARVGDACIAFAKKLMTYKWERINGRSMMLPDKVYASSNKLRNYFRFHRNHLEPFTEHLKEKGVHLDYIHFIELPTYEPAKVVFKVKPEWKPKDYQVPVIEYLSKTKPNSRLAELQTGDGKTFCSLMAIANLGVRTVIAIKAGDLDKWYNDLIKTYNNDPEEYAVISGNGSLRALLEEAKEGTLNYSVILLSLPTYRNWITEYEDFGDMDDTNGYPCRPQEFFEFIGAGVRLNDETHRDFHFVFKMDCYAHLSHGSISLSATLITKDSFLSKIYDVLLPYKLRMPKRPLRKYADVTSVLFSFQDKHKIKTEQFGSKNYSHSAVETSILENKDTTNNYLDLIDHILQISFFRSKRPKKKALVFAATVEMCTLLTDHFSKKYKDLDVRRYTSEDPYENVIDSGLRFTTLGSAGTAIDIPDLITVVMTNALQSVQANVQALGRLRELPDSPVEFYYFVADNITKQIQYHNEKKELFADRAKTHNDYISGRKI